jgi:DNA polymerase III subunit gamma/tau
MAYMALYRAYRPQKFSEVVGQRHIVRTLQNAIKLNKVAHAYLFCGPRGTGKTTMAKIMAKALNCEKGMVEEPCCECENCIGIMKGQISDVIEMDAASNNGIDEIRDIREKVKLMPAYGRYKVYIIDEVHMLSTQAFNALLKTLEEPPSYCVFILCTTDPQKIPMTILSRCQRFDFQGISPEDVKFNLSRVAKSENIKVTDDALDLISEACEGGMRDALSLLDQSISFSSDDVVDLDDVTLVSGSVNKDAVIKLIENAYNNNQEEILKITNEIISEGKEIEKITTDIISFLRDLLMYKSKFGSKAIYNNKKFQELSDIPNEYIYSWLQELNNVQNNIKFTNQKRAYLELGLLKMADVKINNYNDLMTKIKEMEGRISYLERRKPTVVLEDSNKNEKINNEPLIKPIEIKKDNAVLNNMESAKEVLNDVEVDDTFISPDMVLDILNNGDKQLKNDARMVLLSNDNNKIFTTFKGLSLEAAGNNKALLVLPTVGLCNMIMQDKNYQAILNVFKDNNLNILDYIAIPKDTWNQIFKIYAQAFKNKEVPDLSGIKILVKKHVSDMGKKDELDDLATDLFPDNNIIVEK